MCTKPGWSTDLETLRNISDFENVPKRGWLLVVNDLESNEVDFKVLAGPDRGPVEISLLSL